MLALSVNGVTFSYPQTGDEDWGDQASGWASAITTGTLQKAGGAFTLTADVDFGTSFGPKAAYYKSRGTVSTTGVLRLANNEGVGFRNAANSADLILKVNASDLLEYNGTVVGGIIPTTLGGTGLTSYTTGDTLYASAANTLSKLAIGTARKVKAVNAAGTLPEWVFIVDAHIDAAAAIARTKIASGTSYRILANTSAGVMSENAALTAAHVVYADSNGQLAGEARLSKSRGGTGADNSSLTFPSTGTVLSTTNTVASTIQKLTSGSTYTLPSSPRAPLYIKVRMVGAGGGGGGTGTASATDGGVGGNTTFSTFTANGGAAGLKGTAGGAGTGGAGGVISGSPSPIGITGQNGANGIVISTGAPQGNPPGGNGGQTPFGGAGVGSTGNGANPSTNCGSGGAGGAGNTSVYPGGGGGAGGYVEHLIASPASTYSYGVGASGTAGAAGTSGNNGSAGSAGVIIVEEFYQ